MKKKIKKAPIVFEPYLKSVIWGGNKICRYKNIAQPEPNIGESWEISVVPGHESVVRVGEYKGRKITDLIEEFGEELLGKKVVEKYGSNFPLLVKFIDANDNLSVQVHPNDQLAMQRHNSYGKTEMWYIISSDKDAKIFSGLKIKMTPEEYEKRVNNGSFAETIASHESHPGDVFFLPAGRVHAIGAGNLLAEIQQSSDITYRIYDYDRKDKNGNTRELHTSQAKDAIDYTVYPDYRSPAPSPSDEDAELIRCEHFNVHRLKIDGNREVVNDDSSFIILVCVEGAIGVACKEGDIEIQAGHSALIPASANDISFSGKGILLTSRV